MSEEEAVYKTETQEAMEMLGVGYDEKQPSIIFQPKRKAVALLDSGLAEYDVWGWVKVSANFINHIQKLSGANLKCWLVIGLAIDEFGKCKLTIKQLQTLTKLSHTEVINSTKELEEMGYLQIKRNARGNEYTPVFVARGVGNDPEESVVKKVESTLVYQVESTPPIEKLHPSIKELKELSSNSSKAEKQLPENSDIAFLLANDQPITQAQQVKHKTEHDAIMAFESAFGISTTSWAGKWFSNKPEWNRFRKWVTAQWLTNGFCFDNYVLFKKGDGKFLSLMDAPKIARNPDDFYTSWDVFLRETIGTSEVVNNHTDEKGLPLT